MQTLKKKPQQADYIQMKRHSEIIKLFKDRHIMTGIDSKIVQEDVKRMKELLKVFTTEVKNID